VSARCLEQPGAVDVGAENNIQHMPDGLLPRSVIRYDSRFDSLSDRLQSRRLAIPADVLSPLLKHVPVCDMKMNANETSVGKGRASDVTAPRHSFDLAITTVSLPTTELRRRAIQLLDMIAKSGETSGYSQRSAVHLPWERFLCSKPPALASAPSNGRMDFVKKPPVISSRYNLRCLIFM
jgi:hypothetical protein